MIRRWLGWALFRGLLALGLDPIIAAVVASCADGAT